VVASVRFGEAFRVWLRIGLLSFGGPAGQIALMHRILVDEKQWISEARFLHALNYCMLLPGPEAQQLATYVGWLLHRTVGGLVAGILFVLPGAVVILVLSILYAGFRDVTLVQALFFGIKAAVLAVVIEAVIRIGKRALKNRAMYAIAAAAFVAIFFLEAPFPLIVIGAAVIGFIGGKMRPPSACCSGSGRSRSCGRRSARATSSCRKACSSARWQSSPSVAPTPCWPMSRSRRWRPTSGSRRARCSTAWAWRRRRQVR
jgi:chromate transporter